MAVGMIFFLTNGVANIILSSNKVINANQSSGLKFFPAIVHSFFIELETRHDRE